ncbi:hypothetical protein L1F06_012775 [Ectopseudomonas hydrolytica]|uniref:Uncharacterized protein n=1 Tax=Ectopseudomonas hydrolytica TaxID=2493633 RepID=A0ABY5A1K4_9GAMM|nr:hypothetical protein [Pseudomonas hydrolytica]USR37571.1 hypothetical protein L1F06_012775 [Pseudomonas hydrolytica]
MPHTSSPAPLSVDQARAESVGYLALAHLGERRPLQVLRSGAGYYIGTADEDGPVSRESVEYFRSFHAADQALTTGDWQQRLQS